MSKMNWRQSLQSAITCKVADKYKPMLRLYGRSREAAINFIEGIGGYSDRHDRFALSWSAKCYDTNFDVDHLYTHDAAGDFDHLKKLCKNDGERGVLYGYFSSVLAGFGEALWDIATEEAWESFKDDAGSFWGASLDCEWGLRGRSGGNLVLERCGDLRTTVSPEELAEALRERDTDERNRYSVDHSVVAHLLLTCIQIEADWDRPAIVAEVEHRAAWRVWATLDEGTLRALLAQYNDPASIVDPLKEGDTDALPAITNFVAVLLGQKDPES